MNVITKRTKEFLSESVFKNEFSHTVLHNEDVFKGKKPSPQSAPKKQAPSAASRPPGSRSNYWS